MSKHPSMVNFGFCDGTPSGVTSYQQDRSEQDHDSQRCGNRFLGRGSSELGGKVGFERLASAQVSTVGAAKRPRGSIAIPTQPARFTWPVERSAPLRSVWPRSRVHATVRTSQHLSPYQLGQARDRREVSLFPCNSIASRFHPPISGCESKFLWANLADDGRVAMGRRYHASFAAPDARARAGRVNSIGGTARRHHPSERIYGTSRSPR